MEARYGNVLAAVRDGTDSLYDVRTHADPFYVLDFEYTFRKSLQKPLSPKEQRLVDSTFRQLRRDLRVPQELLDRQITI